MKGTGLRLFPFLIGAVVGSVVGMLLGSLFGAPLGHALENATEGAVDRVFGKRDEELRFELLQRLAKDAQRHLILLTATPHSGDEAAFYNLLSGEEKPISDAELEAKARAEHWLARVGLSDRMDNLPSQLSGGQQQRVGIARAVAMEPKVLLLDEITSALDPELVGEVLAVVRKLAEDGMTMLVVTHEMTFARDVGSHLVFMDGGRKIEEGPPREMLRNPQHERLKSFLSRIEMH